MEPKEDDDEHGVLLYYNYAQIPDLHTLFAFYESNCKSLHLLGRVRLSSLGVNVTVGGKLSSLKNHIAELEAFDGSFRGTDFKLAASPRPSNDIVAKECGFTSLSIRIVKELVTLHSNPLLEPPEISEAGKHLSALEFHSVLQESGKSSDRESLVLLDARNLYETRIGKFNVPSVETLDPSIRQYSDLPSWIDDNSEELRGKNVLMYCTGGIRCEMASAYIRSKGAGFENVFQLYGGIQRYMEQFPDGGFFKGKNFVFDHRISVGSSGTETMGCCLLCDIPFDDYSPRLRCFYCRMLVLVCDSCQKAGSKFACELCKKQGKSDVLNATLETELTTCIPQNQIQDFHHQRKLRILCLHGFRQNASGFKGRTASLAKKLKSIVEFIYVNAPHELPFIYQPNTTDSTQNLPQKCNKKFAWLVDPNFRHGGDSDWKIADSSVNALQYQQQIGGFEASVAFLEEVFSREKKIDGIMGFSQGAAMASALCAQIPNLRGKIEFRFAILCSGFASKLPELHSGLIKIPSLHIFGSDDGKDRQIANRASSELASLFDEGCSVKIEHDSGHIIPTRSPYIDEVKHFLHRFLCG